MYFILVDWVGVFSYKILASDDLDPLLVWVDKENLIEFLIYYTLLIQLLHDLCTIFPYSLCDSIHVTVTCNIVMWYFPILFPCIVSSNKKRKENNDLVI